MRLFLVIFVFVLLVFRNLSAYQEISIQKNNQLNNYNDLLLFINEKVSKEDIKKYLEESIYNINFSQQFIKFEFDFLKLSNDLEKKNIQNNLLFLNCSLEKNFFNFDFEKAGCPNFKLNKFENKKFIYLNYKNKLFRIKEYNADDDLNNIWINLFKIRSLKYILNIDADSYNNIILLTDYSPKILEFKDKKINIQIKSIYSPIQYNFLLNFFK